MRYDARKCGMLTSAVSQAWTPRLTRIRSPRPVSSNGTRPTSDNPPAHSASTSGDTIAARRGAATEATAGVLVPEPAERSTGAATRAASGVRNTGTQKYRWGACEEKTSSETVLRESAICFPDQGFEVEGVGHAQLEFALGVPRPLLRRTIPGELEADSVGIGEIDRNAYAMIRGTAKRNAPVGEPANSDREIPACGISDRRM